MDAYLDSPPETPVLGKVKGEQSCIYNTQTVITPQGHFSSLASLTLENENKLIYKFQHHEFPFTSIEAQFILKFNYMFKGSATMIRKTIVIGNIFAVPNCPHLLSLPVRKIQPQNLLPLAKILSKFLSPQRPSGFPLPVLSRIYLKTESKVCKADKRQMNK